MEKVAKIVSREVSGWNYKGEPTLWRIMLDDGRNEYIVDLTPESLRKHVILYQLQGAGVNMELVDELMQIVSTEE